MCNAFTSTQGPVHLWGGGVLSCWRSIYHICKDIFIQLFIYIGRGEKELAICAYFNKIREHGFKLEPWKIWALEDSFSHIIATLA